MGNAEDRLRAAEARIEELEAQLWEKEQSLKLVFAGEPKRRR